MQTLKLEKRSNESQEHVCYYFSNDLCKLPAANDDNPLNILLVEDDDVAVESVKRCLRKFGANFPITVADDGRKALDILHDKSMDRKIDHPCLVLLDLKLPHMDGFTFLKELRADPALCSTLAFVLTTSNDEADREKAYHEQVAAYLVKDSRTLFNRLYTLLSKYC